MPRTFIAEWFLTLFNSTRNTERFTFQPEPRFASGSDGPFDFVGILKKTISPVCFIGCTGRHARYAGSGSI